MIRVSERSRDEKCHRCVILTAQPATPGTQNCHTLQEAVGRDDRSLNALLQSSSCDSEAATLANLNFLRPSAAPAFIINERHEIVLWSEGMTDATTIALPVGEIVDSLPFVSPADREHACSVLVSALEQPPG